MHFGLWFSIWDEWICSCCNKKTNMWRKQYKIEIAATTVFQNNSNYTRNWWNKQIIFFWANQKFFWSLRTVVLVSILDIVEKICMWLFSWYSTFNSILLHLIFLLNLDKLKKIDTFDFKRFVCENDENTIKRWNKRWKFVALWWTGLFVSQI